MADPSSVVVAPSGSFDTPGGSSGSRLGGMGTAGMPGVMARAATCGTLGLFGLFALFISLREFTSAMILPFYRASQATRLPRPHNQARLTFCRRVPIRWAKPPMHALENAQILHR